MKRTAESELGPSPLVVYQAHGQVSCASSSSDIITLNVGGTLHTTTRHVLVGSAGFFPHSLLARMFSHDAGEPTEGDGPVVVAQPHIPTRRDAQGHYFIDADFAIFRHVLNVLRHPKRARIVPADMTSEEWADELDYWGLVERDDVESTTTVVPANRRLRAEGDEPPLSELGAAIRQDLMDTEAQVIRALFAGTGYDRPGGKTREDKLRVPMHKYAMPWAQGGDLGSYILKNASVIASLIKAMLQLDGAFPVGITESRTPVHHMTYVFDGKQYTTQESTLTVTISYNNVDTLKQRVK